MPNLLPLRPQQVVRFQTDKGYQKVGVIKQPAAQPRSYIVEAEGKEYHRNRRPLLSVLEPAPTKLMWPTDYDVLHVPSSHVMPPTFQSPPEQSPHLRILRGLPRRFRQDPVTQRGMLRDMEGWLNQIQSSETLWPDNKTLILNELLLLSFILFIIR